MIEIGSVYKVYMTQCNLSKNYFKTNSIHLLFFGREGEIEVPRHRYRTCALLKLSCIATLKKSCKHDHLFFKCCYIITLFPLKFPQSKYNLFMDIYTHARGHVHTIYLQLTHHLHCVMFVTSCCWYQFDFAAKLEQITVSCFPLNIFRRFAIINVQNSIIVECVFL